MWTCEHDWYAVLLVKLHHRCRRVIWSSIKKYDRILSPLLILAIQMLYQSAEKHLHHLTV